MMKQYKQVKRQVSLALQRFYQDEKGVYSIMMAVLVFLLMGLVAFAVDGSGMMLDKARFTQGVEQAGLALIAENNKTREDQEHSDVSRQIVSKEDEEKFGSELRAKQDKRNQELIRGLVRTYYYPRTYRKDNRNIADNYSYRCDNIRGRNDERLKTVACEIKGDFQRPSWLYYGENTLSFKKENKIASDTVYVQKNLDEVVPIDLMLVTDLTGSMKQKAPGTNTPKIDSLRRVVKTVAEELLEKERTADGKAISPHNRIGFTSFAFGAQQKNNATSCYFPFVINHRTLVNRIINGSISNSNIAELNRFTNYKKTVDSIDKYDGKDRSDGFSFAKNKFCLDDGTGKSIDLSTNFWFDKGKSKELSTSFNRINPNGATLSSSGLLVGANLLLNKNSDEAVQPKKLSANTQRILLVLSDGKDEIYQGASVSLDITPNLINQGMCEAIKKKIDTLQDPEIATQATRIGFVAFGYGPEGNQKDAWQKCVGKDYYVASNEKELLESFRKIIGLVEEVGHSTNKKPNYYPNK